MLIAIGDMYLFNSCNQTSSPRRTAGNGKKYLIKRMFAHIIYIYHFKIIKKKQTNI